MGRGGEVVVMKEFWALNCLREKAGNFWVRDIQMGVQRAFQGVDGGRGHFGPFFIPLFFSGCCI